MELKPASERFKGNVHALSYKITQLLNQLISKGDFEPKGNDRIIILAIPEVIRNQDSVNLIENFIRKSYPFWNQIKERDLNFFVDNADEIFMLKDSPLTNKNLFSELFTSVNDEGKALISEEFLESVWNNFTANVKISLKYIHENRKPKAYSDSCNNIHYLYENPDFFGEIDISEYANLFNIKFAV